jgi:4-diphosphocytidyl-2-C-methyl-D-erythritol kinase
MTPVIDALAPAKLNLGLEVIGRRDDGYHEIATVMQTVGLFDRLSFTSAGEPSFLMVGHPFAHDDNLVPRAAETLRRRLRQATAESIRLAKRIPAAAGLGGASSDAAATLTALPRLWSAQVDPALIEEVARSLGSDVPFFLRGGTALATGRGERLRRLRTLRGVWFIVVAPDIVIPRKTATLYTALTPSDFSPGDRARRLAETLDLGKVLDPTLLGNAFLRPLLALRPELCDVASALLAAGAPFATLTGAGPAHYTAVDDLERARSIARRIRARLPDRTDVFVCRPVANAPLLTPPR